MLDLLEALPVQSGGQIKCTYQTCGFTFLPDSRNSSVAIKLVKSFIKIGNEANMKIKLGHVYSGDFERKDKFFGRLGLVKAGSLYTEVN